VPPISDKECAFAADARGSDRAHMRLSDFIETILRPFIRDSLRLAFDLRAWRAGFMALRMPSLVIAAFSCALGAVLAWHDGRGDVLNTVAVMVCGLALQAGVNLVNDFFEFRQKKVHDKVAAYGFSAKDREFLELLIFLVGLALFGFSGLAGLFLVLAAAIAASAAAMVWKRPRA